MRTNISPSYFSPDLAAALKNLSKRQNQNNGNLNPEEQDQKSRLEELKRTLPNIKADDGLTEAEKA